MLIDVATILGELRRDHRNMTLLLDVVDAQSTRVSTGDEPDLELLRDIMHYMTVYSDAVHHPREDLVYEAMCEHGASVADGLEAVAGDHADIAELGGRLRADVEAAMAGSAVKRERLLRDLRDYAARLRRHMQWEEDDLFLRADALARDLPGWRIDTTGLAASDPLFGAATAPSFANLASHLR